MLTPFNALLPRDSDVEYWALERAAKALRPDPARYQSVEGVEYDRSPECLFRWEIEFDEARVTGLVGLYPIERLVPHESTLHGVAPRPLHRVQIRPVTALVETEIPGSPAVGPTVHFHGEHHHSVTPVAAIDVDFGSAVIADGHHRVAAARAYSVQHVMTLLVDIRNSSLEAGAFHRYFERTPKMPDHLPGCEVVHESPRDSIHHGRMAIVTAAGSRGIAVTDPSAAQFDGLPAGLAARYVLPHLGLDEADARYVDDIRTTLGLVDKGGLAVVLPPTRLDAVLRVARGAVSLPPKSTRFRPKPIKGLLMRPLPD